MKDVNPEVETSDPTIPALPPKVVSLQARGQAPARLSSAQLDRSTAGLPVLEAFQQFLDAERRRTRNRALATLSICVAILLIIGAAVLFFSTTTFQRMSGQLQGVESDILSVKQETLKLRDEAAAALAKLANPPPPAKDKRIDDVTVELGSVSSELDALRARNGELMRDLDAIHDVIPSLSGDMEMVIKLLAQLKAESAATPPPTPALPVSEPAPNNRPTPHVISITPYGQDRAIAWLVELP